jgi:hypothetical protein
VPVTTSAFCEQPQSRTIPFRLNANSTDPDCAAELSGIPRPAMKALSTFWHTAAEPPSPQRLLHLDADRRGPVINTAVLTAVAPT